MQRIRAWLGRERPVVFFLLASLAVLVVLTGIVPATVGGWSVQSAVLAVFGVALGRGSVALWKRIMGAGTNRDHIGPGD